MKNSLFLSVTLLLTFACSPSEDPVTSSSPTPLLVSNPSPTASPFPLASPTVSPSPSSTPAPEASISVTPSAAPQLRYLPENNLATRLFSIDSETGQHLAWQTQFGETKLFDGSSAKTLIPSTKYELVNPMLGYINGAQQGLLLAREEKRSSHPNYENTGDSHALTLEGGKVLQEATFEKLQIRAVGLTPSGDGYVLFSNENRYSPSSTGDLNTYPKVALYSAKVEGFVVGETALVFETEFDNISGKQVVHNGNIKPDGSGFFLYPSEMGFRNFNLQRFNQKKEIFAPQVFQQPLKDYSLLQTSDKGGDFLATIEVDRSDRKNVKQTLVIHAIADSQLTGQVYRYPSPYMSGGSLREDYSLSPYDFMLDKEGNGVFVSVRRDEKSMSDIVLVQKIRGFVFDESQAWVYPNHAAVIDLKLVLNAQGEGKLVMIEGKCSTEKRCYTFFPEREKMQLSYLSVRDFLLD